MKSVEEKTLADYEFISMKLKGRLKDVNLRKEVFKLLFSGSKGAVKIRYWGGGRDE